MTPLFGLVLLAIALSVCAWLCRRKRTEIRNMANAANAPNAGRHVNGRKTFLADAAIARWSVVIIGTDENHVAIGASATELPIGIVEDQALAAEDPVSVALIPGCVGTTICIATGVIVAGALVQSNGNGTVKTLVSTGYAIGRAIQASGATGDQIEVALFFTGLAL
jgi:hypothetical protein